MKEMMRRAFTLMICCVLALGLVPPTLAKAENETGSGAYKTVRVGWYESPMFQEGVSDSEIKSGYCYDYLQKVADYTSWRYEYVYGNWGELFQKLQSGEIDLLGGVSVTDERRQTMLFPDYAMGTDQYYLFKRSDNGSISLGDISSLNGKVLGAIGNNRMTVMAEEWIRENGLNMDIVYFQDFGEQGEALQNGQVDLIVQTINNVLNMAGIDIITKVGEEPFYLAVSKENEGLLTELNYLLGKLLSIDPYILQDLQYKNYGSNLVNKTLGEDEQQWIDAHEKVIVGYLDNYLPYSAADENGNATGLLTDVFAAVASSLGLEGRLVPEYRAFENYGDMIDALKRNEIHTAFPVYGNPWDLEMAGINASSSVVQSSETYFHKGSYSRESVERIAVNSDNDLQQAYCKRAFPTAQFVYASSIEECLSLVLNGKADGTVVNTLRTEMVTRDSKYNALSYVQLEIDDSRCFGVNEGDAELLTVLNRGLRAISPTFGIDNAYKYMEDFYQYSVVDFLRDNIGWIALISGAVVLVIIMLLVVNLRRKAGEVMQKEESIRQANAFNQKIEQLKDKADKANAAKTLFLNNMSHDIRTPMNAIIGYTDIAQKQETNPETKKCLDKIRASSEHLLSLINDVLDISRIESGTVKINEDVTDVSGVTDEALSIVRGFLADRKLDFKVEKLENVTPLVVTDALKIREILVNILSNAVKFTDDGGSIRFVYELNGMQDGRVMVRYTVSDTGKGMSESFQGHIFDEFAQENNGARTQYKGTGLGLAITKKYVDMMGGTISFESLLGKGTTFTVELPMKASDCALPEKAEKAPYTLDVRGLKVLLVEDNDLNAEIAEIQLEDAGLVVTRVADGREAVEAFRDSPADSFDLILMDVMMPNMNGYEATKAIRSMQDRPDGKTIPIVAMTANAFSEDVQKSFEAGMTAHLTKPIKSEELIKTVAQIAE